MSPPRALPLLLILLVAGCAGTLQPDLARFYRPVATLPKAHPLILIPGVMGSRLLRADNKAEVWPGSLWGMVMGKGYSDLALPIAGTGAIAPAHRVRSHSTPADSSTNLPVQISMVRSSTH